MRARTTILLSLAFVLLLAVLWALTRAREPSYQNRPLSQWCEDVRTSHPFLLNTNAVHAIQTIGTNAIPWLMRDLKARGSTLHFRVNLLLQKQSLLNWRFPDVNRRLSRATWGFVALGDLGTPAIPELEQMIAEKPGYVPGALAGIGHNAVPALCRALTNNQPYVPSNTAGYIANSTSFGRLGSNDLVILLPLMQQLSNSTNAHFAGRAKSALQTLQANGFLEGEFTKYRVK